MKTYKTFTVESKAVDEEQGIYEAMVSTESVDRDGDILLAEGCDITNYLKNPLVLWGHNYWTPDAVVARTLEVSKIAGRGVKLVFQFVERGINATADLVHDLWAGGYLRAMSVGFIPKVSESRPEAGDGGYMRGGYIYRVWELLEGSIVTIPANQDALRLAFEAMQAKGYGEQELKQVFFEQKRGRVLSAANEKSIRTAVALLQEVLGSLGEEPEQDSFDPENAKMAMPYRDHGMADEDESWSAPGLADFTDEKFADLSDVEKKRIAAHYTWSANMPPEAFGDLKLPHHKAQKDGVGQAVWRGVASAMSVLMGGRGGVDMPEEDKKACYEHLSKHYEEFSKEPPEMRAYSEDELNKLFPDIDQASEQQGSGDEEPNNDETTHDESEAAPEPVLDALGQYFTQLKNTLTEVHHD
jgi:hypothetical protein